MLNQLAPANNPVVKANPQGLAAAAQAPAHPGTPPQVQPQPQPAAPTISALPGWLQTGQGPVTSQIPARTPLKGSPTTPQPLSSNQAGAFPAKQADLLPGGPADNMPDKRFAKKPLLAGIAHEKEHTVSQSLAKEIAKDHLVEHPGYYAHGERKVAASQPKWGRWQVDGLEAMADIGRYMRTSAKTNSDYRPEDIAEEEKTASAEPVSEFAAAFFLGCRERGLSLTETQRVTKTAAALDDIISVELSGLSDALFAYCGRLEKRALVTMPGGDFMPPAPKIPAPKIPAPSAPAAVPAAAAPPAATSAAPAAAAPSAATAATPATPATPAFSRVPSATAAAFGAPGMWAEQAVRRAPGWWQQGKQQFTDGAGEVGTNVVKQVGPHIGDEIRKQMRDPETAKALGGMASETVNNAAGGMMNNMFQGWSARDPKTLGGNMGKFWDTMQGQGLPTAVSEAWGNMTPQQQWGLLAGVGGPLLGMGAAAAGHPLLGLGLGAAGLAGGAYGLHRGSGDVGDMFRPAGEAGKNFDTWRNQSDQAAQVAGLPRGQQYGWWEQQLADHKNQQAAQPTSELVRAAGPPVAPGG